MISMSSFPPKYSLYIVAIRFNRPSYDCNFNLESHVTFVYCLELYNCILLVIRITTLLVYRTNFVIVCTNYLFSM